MTTRESSVPRLHLVTNGEILRRPRSLVRLADLAACGSAELRIHIRAPHATGAFLTECVAAAVERVGDAALGGFDAMATG